MPLRPTGRLSAWEDLDLAAERPTLTICGTLVFVKGQGIFRQPWTKSDAGYRMVVLPRFAAGVLLARKLGAAENPHDAIFASRMRALLQLPGLVDDHDRIRVTEPGHDPACGSSRTASASHTARYDNRCIASGRAYPACPVNC